MCVCLMSMMLFSCENYHNQNLEDSNNHKDSTYNHYRDSLILNEQISAYESLKLIPINEWSEIIRLRGTNSWGTFDFICSIYSDGNKRIQLIKKNKVPKSTSHFYIYKEKTLKDAEYDSIKAILVKNDIHHMPFDLEPEYDIMDGDEYYIAIKNHNYTKVVTWQNKVELESDDKRKAIDAFREILKYSGYPKPKAYMVKKNLAEDSVEYSVFLDDYEFVKSHMMKYGNIWIEPIEDYFYELQIPVKDTLNLNKKISIQYLTMENDTVEIEKIENL